MTLLPDPVDPAISRCGMDSSAATRIRPLMSLPSGMVRREADCANSSLSSIWRSAITSRLGIGHLDAHGRLAGNALDENGFGLQAEAQIFGQVGDAAVFDAGFGLEFEGGDHRAGVDLHHVSKHVELFELGFDARRRFPSVPVRRKRLRAGISFSNSVEGSENTARNPGGSGWTSAFATGMGGGTGGKSSTGQMGISSAAEYSGSAGSSAAGGAGSPATSQGGPSATGAAS